MKKSFGRLKSTLNNLQDVPLLLLRLILAYGFLMPAMKKLGDINQVSSWFASMNFPMPKLSAYLTAGTEGLGVILLALGLGTRIISIPLMFVMLVAIFAVHLPNGFAAANGGFEIPLYYFIMLSVLFFKGSGKFSLDYVIGKNTNMHSYYPETKPQEVTS